ncbi:X-ray radiation resistance-associated protein 1 isoform X2 [Chaetodon auriga]|uniref:X-ray radiation resistance-associated protein 1 isoform X2 n=1 Tax=Chaetodon auriga TaxID=39042 RepID=UPI004032B68E
MTAASNKLDDGKSYPTKCFPARTLLHRKREGGGHWLVAYGKAEEQRYRTVRRRIKETHRECEKDRGTDRPRGNTLDGPFLLQLHCVDEPSELCSVDVSEQNLDSVKPEDLKAFDGVVYIDASVNSLSLGSFSSFVSLRELNLSLNRLCNMTFHAADFPYLEVLDLSYNSLSADDLVSIGHIPRLKVLRLTGNQLHHLPPNLASSDHDTTQLPPEEEHTRFKALEVLVLDDNRLSSEVFNSLANLKRLKCLNLQGNRISQIPYLQLADGSKPLQTSTAEHVKRLSQERWEEYCRGSSFPLPQLQFLNLADNKIAEEEALMAVALFPKLREIDIHSNPLTTQRSGDPPLLTYYLQERLGITIRRKKTLDVGKLPLKVSIDPKWKVEERIPKVSKKPLVMDAPCPAQLERRELNTEHFFLTQATDAPEYQFDPQADETETREKEETNRDDTRLMDVTLNPDVVQPIGIQTAVRMLEHTLRNLNVYRDSKPKLDCIQTPYRGREKKIKELPPLKPMKRPAERVEEMIKEIKGSTTIRQVPLSSALCGTGVNKQEALSLLRDMKTKYKMVHKKTMEQAASIEYHRNTDRSRAEAPAVQML